MFCLCRQNKYAFHNWYIVWDLNFFVKNVESNIFFNAKPLMFIKTFFFYFYCLPYSNPNLSKLVPKNRFLPIYSMNFCRLISEFTELLINVIMLILQIIPKNAIVVPISTSRITLLENLLKLCKKTKKTLFADGFADFQVWESYFWHFHE